MPDGTFVAAHWPLSGPSYPNYSGCWAVAAADDNGPAQLDLTFSDSAAGDMPVSRLTLVREATAPPYLCFVLDPDDPCPMNPLLTTDH